MGTAIVERLPFGCGGSAPLKTINQMRVAV